MGVPILTKINDNSFWFRTGESINKNLNMNDWIAKDENDYVEIAKEFGVEELENEHEERLYKEKSPVAFIKNFPEFTSPFWNMKRNTENNTGKKVDVVNIKEPKGLLAIEKRSFVAD